MFQKKFWIPIVFVLIGVAIGGTFWSQHISSQEPIKVYKTTPMERPPVRETPVEPTVEGGHFHADGTFHAAPHETAPVEVSAPDPEVPEGSDVAQAFLKDVDATHTPFETYDEMQTFLDTASSEDIYERIRDMYVARHYRKYPDCTGHDALLADAEREAAYYLKDLEHRKIEAAVYAEWKQALHESNEVAPPMGSPEALALLQRIKSMTKEERLALAAKVRAASEKFQTVAKNLEEIRRQRPVSPERMHTHYSKIRK